MSAGRRGGKNVWPASRDRRLGGYMAASAAHSQTPSDRPPLSRETIAEILVTRRQQLLRQLPRQIRISRGLTHDHREWVVVRAPDFRVTENRGAMFDVDAQESA